MKVIDKMTETIRNGIRSFLQIEPAQQNMITINETLDFMGNAAVNRIWQRGDGEELSQLYKSIPGDTSRFWAAVPFRDIRKIHTGLPGIIVNTLTSMIIADMNDIELDDSKEEQWKVIAGENNFIELVSDALTDTLVVGDGAFRVCFDPKASKMPIIEFVSGENVEYVRNYGRVREVIFKKPINYKYNKYTLLETYGYGYIKSELYMDNRQVKLDSIPVTASLPEEITFDDSFMMAVPFFVFKSSKYKGRGKSVFDGKTDNFDALDECWSQWMDALRRGRSKEYIPTGMVPRNPYTGELVKPNAFDNSFIERETSMAESSNAKIELIQPAIPHESYLSTYVTALDQCLQGLISPSTIGIDVKKLDNAEAQREKEKTTLYTRNKIVDAIQNTIPKLVDVVFKSYATYMKQPLEDIKADISFGEYANPSFESQVETVSKAKQGGIMSIEAAVNELYGDTKDEKWKLEEIARIKSESGIAQMEEPAVNADMELEGKLNNTREETTISTLNGAQIGSLMNMIAMVKSGQLTRTEAISIMSATPGISRENAETFIENGV